MADRALTIAVDVDEVCADLLSTWLNWYNRKYSDNRLPEDCTEWDMTKNVKPECGADIYEFLDADMYNYIQPIYGARAAVRVLRQMGHRVIFVTSCPKGTADAKLAWLVRWDFLLDTQFQKDFIVCSDKALIRADILIDDNVDTCEKFPGAAILVNHAHNLNRKTSRWRVDSLAKAVELVEQLRAMMA